MQNEKSSNSRPEPSEASPSEAKGADPNIKAWLSHLSDTKPIVVIPYDPTCEAKFQQAKTLVQSTLGATQPVLHRGASALGISGQDEIDVYIPVTPTKFATTVDQMAQTFGKPGSHYPQIRARFSIHVDKKRVDLFVINEEDEGWIRSEQFFNFLSTHPKELEDYRQLKEELSGQNMREYYRRKIEFIDKIIQKLS